MVDEPMSGTLAIVVTLWRSAVRQRSSSAVQAKRPMLAIDKDEIEVELPQNVDHPRGWEGKVVAVRFASGTHGGFDSVGLLHSMSSCVRRLRSDRPILSVFDPLVAAELCTGRSVSSKMRCKAPNWQRPYAP